MRCLVYCRQSVSDSDDTLSLASQSAALHRWAAEQGWHVVGDVRDWDQKGYDDARPGLAEVMARADRREFEILAVWSLDRLARSVRITETTLYELERHGVEIRSHRESWANQPMLRQIIAAVHEQNTRDIQAHVRRALNERSRRGLWHGRAPFGYRRDDAGRLIACENQSEILRNIFSRFIAGAGTSELADWLTGQGIPTLNRRPRWSATTVRDILRNPAYTGAVVVGGVRAEHAHPPLIDDATWRRAQERLADYHWTRRKGDVSSWLEGHIEHVCGARMYLRAQPSLDATTPAFICGMSRHWRRDGALCLIRPARVGAPHAEAEAWSLILVAMHRLRSPERVYREAIRREVQLAPRLRTEQRNLLDRQRDLRKHQMLAEDLYLSGQRDRAWFDATDAPLAVELADIARRLTALPQAPALEDLTARHAQLAAIAGRLDLLVPADRGAILAALGAIVVGAGVGRKPPLCIRWRPEIAPFLGGNQ